MPSEGVTPATVVASRRLADVHEPLVHVALARLPTGASRAVAIATFRILGLAGQRRRRQRGEAVPSLVEVPLRHLRDDHVLDEPASSGEMKVSNAMR